MNQRHIETFLLLLEAGNYEQCHKLNPEYAQWVLLNTHPLTPPLENMEEIPFYSFRYERSFKKLFQKIRNKENIFNSDFKDTPNTSLITFKKEEPVFPNIYYNLGTDPIHVCVYKETHYKVMCNVKLPTIEYNIFKAKVPHKMYYFGVLNSKGLHFYHYLTKEEFNNQKYAEEDTNFNLRTVLSRNLLEEFGLKKFVHGELKTNQLKKGSYIWGNTIWSMKEAKI